MGNQQDISERVSQGSTATAVSRSGPMFTRFTGQDVPDSSLEQIVQSALRAPSEWNFQPWRWVVVRSDTGKNVLEAATYIKVPLSTAPVVLICLADTLAWKSAPQHLKEMVTNQQMTEAEARETLRKIGDYYSASPQIAERAALASAFVALHQLLLAANDQDLSAYWVTEFNEQKVKTHFHIPDHFLVTALFAVGYRSESGPAPAPDLPLKSLLYREKFGESFSKKT
jgi:nitroreductase